MAKGLIPQVGALGVVALRIGLAAVLLLALWRPRIRDRTQLATLVPFGLVLGGRVLVLGAAVAVLSSALPYTLDLVALRSLPAQGFGVPVSHSPAIAALVGVIALDEMLLLRQWIAVALVVVASAGVTLSETPR